MKKFTFKATLAEFKNGRGDEAKKALEEFKKNARLSTTH